MRPCRPEDITSIRRILNESEKISVSNTIYEILKDIEPEYYDGLTVLTKTDCINALCLNHKKKSTEVRFKMKTKEKLTVDIDLIEPQSRTEVITQTANIMENTLFEKLI